MRINKQKLKQKKIDHNVENRTIILSKQVKGYNCRILGSYHFEGRKIDREVKIDNVMTIIERSLEKYKNAYLSRNENYYEILFYSKQYNRGIVFSIYQDEDIKQLDMVLTTILLMYKKMPKKNTILKVIKERLTYNLENEKLYSLINHEDSYIHDEFALYMSQFIPEKHFDSQEWYETVRTKVGTLYIAISMLDSLIYDLDLNYSIID